MGERLAAVRNSRVASQLLCLHILKPLAAPQGKQKVLLLGGRLQHARVGKNDGLVFVRTSHTIYHYTIQFARIEVLLLHIKVGIGDAVVENALRNLKLRTLLLHRHQHQANLLVGVRADGVLEIKRRKTDEHRYDNERTESLHKRYAGSLDSRKLRTFAHIAKGDKRRKQYGKRQSLRNKHQAHVPEELGKNFHRQALAYKLVDITPQELHHQHKLADEEGSYEQKAKLLGDEYI